MNDGALRALLIAIARDFGSPCYVYFVDRVRERVAAVRAAFGDRFRVSYAVKSNPNRALLRRLRGVVDLLDVSSAGEVRAALAVGWPAAALSFTGPGKTAAELRAAVEARIGAVVVESLDEAAQLDAICRATAARQPVLVRLSPSRVPRGFGLNMSGLPSQFGIDEEDVDAALHRLRGLDALDLRGLHIYSGTQCLKAPAIAENYEIFIELFRRVCATHGLRPQTLVFGAGIGIPYHDADLPADLAAVADAINPSLDRLRSDPAFAAADLVLESGRYLVGEAGLYVTRVLRTKRSRGADIAICDGGMHHHLGAAGHLGSALHRHYRMFKITGAADEPADSTYTLVGPLCTTIDTLARQVRLPALAAGDLIGIHCSGAYGLTASPVHFISHPPPREIIVDARDGAPQIEDASEPLDGRSP